MLVVHTLGERDEEGTRLERVVRRNNRLIVLYRAQVSTSLALFAWTGEVSRWGTIDLDSFYWWPLAGVDTREPEPLRQFFRDYGSPPNIEVPPDREIPLRRIPGGLRNVDMIAYLRNAAGDDPLSVHYFPSLRDGLVLVAVQPRDPLSPRVAHFDRPYTHDRVWWAIPARVLLVPVAVVIDPVFTGWAVYSAKHP